MILASEKNIVYDNAYFLSRYASLGVLAFIFIVLAIVSRRAMNAAGGDEQFRNTRNQLKQVFDALRELMTPPDPPN